MRCTCGKPLPTNEAVAYAGVCEDCWVSGKQKYSEKVLKQMEALAKFIRHTNSDDKQDSRIYST